MTFLEKVTRGLGAVVLALVLCHEAFQPLRDMMVELGLRRVFTSQLTTGLAEFAPLALTPAIYQWLGGKGGGKPG
jgi:hypothetical protein